MSVAKISLANNKIIPEIYLPHILDHIVYVHQSLTNYALKFQQCLKREIYVTPKHYLDYIQSYKKLLGMPITIYSRNTVAFVRKENLLFFSLGFQTKRTIRF